MSTPDLLMYTHHTYMGGGKGRAKERMGEAGRERQSHLWRVEGSGGKREERWKMGWRRRRQVKKSGKGCIEGRGKGWWEVGKGRGRRGGKGRGRKRQERERGRGEKGRERVKK